jgi:protein involved in polysaccharide export with SLBB domain
VLKELNLQGALKGQHIALKGGDTVTISSVDGILMNFVEVSGSVHLTGKMQYIKGEKVNQLIKRANGLRIDAYLGRAYIMRTYRGGEKKYFQINLNDVLSDTNSASNMVLEDLDQFKVFSVHDFHDEYKVEIAGAVRNPTTIDYTENLTLQDLIFFAGGLLHEASNVRIEVSRLVNFTETENDSKPIQFIVENIEVADNLELNKLSEYKLRPQDKVFVRFVEGFQYQRLVVLSGEFKYPGTYALLHNKETIKEVVERAGGLSEGAFLQGAKMFRKADSKGELVVNFVELFEKGKKQYNYVMRSGDSIFVPKIDDIIAITGQIGSYTVAGKTVQNSPYTKGKRAKYYVKEYAGGFAKDADRRKVYVISSSGGMKKTKDFLLFKIYPKVHRGDRIVVDKKPPEKVKTEDPTDWNKVIENLTVKVTGIMTLYLLTKNVFK